MAEVKELEAKIDKLTTDFADQGKKIETLESDVKTANEAKDKSVKEFAAYKETEKVAEFTKWLDSQIKDGKILPANKAATLNNMKILDGNEAQEFSTESGKDAKKVTPLEIYKQGIENGPKLVEFGEDFKNGKAREEQTEGQIKEAVEKLAIDKKIEFNEAMRLYMADNPHIEIKINQA